LKKQKEPEGTSPSLIIVFLGISFICIYIALTKEWWDSLALDPAVIEEQMDILKECR
jgi:hypothetical protein